MSMPLFSCLCFVMFLSKYQACPIPALYIFGDSFFDAGNNNYLPNTRARADKYPYGIDFPLIATGRFTNGRTMVDFFAEWFGLQFQPPILQIQKSLSSYHIYKGFNYASASAGILNETGKFMAGDNLCLKKQVQLFAQTVQEHLQKHYSSNELAQYFSKSIFMLLMGFNDYEFHFVRREPNNTRPSDPDTFSDLLINEVENNLKILHQFGARKFVMFEIPPLGCAPDVVQVFNATTKCVDEVNDKVNKFNIRLVPKIDEWTSTFKGSTFVLAKIFNLTYDMIMNPIYYGMDDSNCCVAGVRNAPVCEDRKAHVFFDRMHYSEATYKIIASKSFNGTGLCVPMNVLQLASKN